MDHSDAQCSGIYSGCIVHWFLANDNGLWCMDLQLDTQYSVRNVWY